MSRTEVFTGRAESVVSSREMPEGITKTNPERLYTR